MTFDIVCFCWRTFFFFLSFLLIKQMRKLNTQLKARPTTNRLGVKYILINRPSHTLSYIWLQMEQLTSIKNNVLCVLIETLIRQHWLEPKRDGKRNKLWVCLLRLNELVRISTTFFLTFFFSFLKLCHEKRIWFMLWTCFLIYFMMDVLAIHIYIHMYICLFHQ